MASEAAHYIMEYLVIPVIGTAPYWLAVAGLISAFVEYTPRRWWGKQTKEARR